MFTIFYELFGGGTRLAMPKTICAPDSSSLKPGSGATEGVLDSGVSGQPDYILWPNYWTMNIQAKFYNDRFTLVYESDNIGDCCYFEAQVW